MQKEAKEANLGERHDEGQRVYGDPVVDCLGFKVLVDGQRLVGPTGYLFKCVRGDP
jgi:hypothetical protein